MSGSALAMEPKPAEFSDDLPEQAASRLGYDFPQRLKKQFDLLRTLIQVGARPLPRNWVEKHKREAARKANPHSLILYRAARLACGIGIFGTVLCFGPALLGWFASWTIGLAFAGGLVACGAITISLARLAARDPGSWNVTSLIGYAGPVPQSVLHQALRIKERLPEAEFFVHEFIQNKKVLDPFLVVRYADHEHFIAVWGEPGFPAAPDQGVPDLEQLLARSQRSRYRTRL